MIPTLDRHLLVQFLRNAALVTVATVIVFVVLDVLLGFQLLTRPAPSPWTKIELFACRIPGLLNFAIPVAAIVAVLATVAPMLRRGEFTALGAAGITLRRSTRTLLLASLAAGIIDVVIADVATPPATAQALALQDLLEGQNREGRVWRGDDGTTWFASGARLVGVEHPELTQVVAANADAMVIADRVLWDGTAWTMPAGCSVLHVGGGGQRLDRQPPGAMPTGIDLGLDPGLLYRRLLPRYTMTSTQLLARAEHADLVTVWTRLSRVFAPMLATMAALAVFVRFGNRDRVAIATIEAVAASLLPTVLLSLGGVAADTTPGPPVVTVTIGVLIAATPALWLWLRWRL